MENKLSTRSLRASVIIVLLAAMLLLSACSLLTDRKVIGVWEYKRDAMTNRQLILYINANHTWKIVHADDDSVWDAREGTWKMKNGVLHLSFYNSYMGNVAYHYKLVDGCLCPSDEYGGNVRYSYSPLTRIK